MQTSSYPTPGLMVIDRKKYDAIQDRFTMVDFLIVFDNSETLAFLAEIEPESNNFNIYLVKGYDRVKFNSGFISIEEITQYLKTCTFEMIQRILSIIEKVDQIGSIQPIAKRRKVTAIQQVKNGKISYFCENGEKIENLVPDGSPFKDYMIENPAIVTEFGTLVWGLECWWGSKDQIEKKTGFSQAEKELVPILKEDEIQIFLGKK